MPTIVVSSPAESSERTNSGASSAVISPVSTAAQMIAPSPAGDSASRAHWALIQGTTFAASAMTASKCALRGPKALKTMAP